MNTVCSASGDASSALRPGDGERRAATTASSWASSSRLQRSRCHGCGRADRPLEPPPQQDRRHRHRRPARPQDVDEHAPGSPARAAPARPGWRTSSADRTDAPRRASARSETTPRRDRASHRRASRADVASAPRRAAPCVGASRAQPASRRAAVVRRARARRAGDRLTGTCCAGLDVDHLEVAAQVGVRAPRRRARGARWCRRRAPTRRSIAAVPALVEQVGDHDRDADAGRAGRARRRRPRARSVGPAASSAASVREQRAGWRGARRSGAAGAAAGSVCSVTVSRRSRATKPIAAAMRAAWSSLPWKPIDAERSSTMRTVTSSSASNRRMNRCPVRANSG